MIRTMRLADWTAVAVAATMIAACGTNDDDNTTTARSTTAGSTTDVATTDPQPPVTESVPADTEVATTTSAPATTAPASTETSSTTTTTTVPAGQWAAEVIDAYDAHLANEVENAQTWVDSQLAAPDDDREVEVDAYLVLATATAADLLDTLEQLPTAPRDPTLADPYDDLIAALRTRAEGSTRIGELIATNLDAYKQEVTANIDEAGQPFDVEVRLGFAQLRDRADAACFELQAALTAANLPLLTCTSG